MIVYAINRVTSQRRWGGVEETEKEGKEGKRKKVDTRETKGRGARSSWPVNRRNRLIASVPLSVVSRPIPKTGIEQTGWWWCVGSKSETHVSSGFKRRSRGRGCYAGPA